MGIFDGQFGGKPQESEPAPAMPWDRKPSILEHVRAHIDPAKPGLTEGGEALPDEEQINAGSQIRWAAGALDGVMTHHAGGGSEDETAQQTVDLVCAYCRQPTAANKARLYQHVIDNQVVSIIDSVLEPLLNRPELNDARLFELAWSFATEAPDREPVKFGIALLGLFGEANTEDLFQTLGRHEEFTLYCAVALNNTSADREQSLWTLARNVSSWGRIHVVERLAETENPEIKDWLLREGYRNAIMYEYLACTCARAGDLLLALSADDVDRGLLTSAGEIIEAIIRGNPGESIDSYEDAPAVLAAYMRHMERTAETLADFLCVHSIQEYVSDDIADWPSRGNGGWTDDLRKSVAATCQQILSRPQWRERVTDALCSENDLEFSRADQAAKALAIETWDCHWRRLQQKPTDSGRWFHAMSQCNEQRIGPAVELAEARIDLNRIAVGPSDEMGIGPGYEHHSALDFVLQGLRRFPRHGQKLIQTGLRSPVVRNRNMAVAALAEWGQAAWPLALRESLQAAANIEPDESVRDRMQKVLRGEPLGEHD